MTIDRASYPGVPEDFPVTAVPSAIGGAQPKMSLVEDDGKFFSPGTSPSEVVAAFQMCDDLVSQMIPYCQRKLATFEGDREATVNPDGQVKFPHPWPPQIPPGRTTRL